tara:strand:- start:7819 stop:9153 length:1335 start_codon:yes stop_codon:yes gene_type:complete
MSILNKLRIEILLFFVITLNVVTTLNVDLTVSNFFNKFTKKYNNLHLENFFINITEMGNSFWYFTISIFFVIILFINKKYSYIKLKDLDIKINFFISGVIYLATIGILTQIIKHIIGRHRPNYTNFDEGVSLNFFTLDSNFHSFPSGHASTIFMVSFILSAVLPKLKYYFFTLACIIAFSRVVVGAHFITDVVAGGLLAYIIYKALNIYFSIYFSKYLFREIVFEKDSVFYHYVFFFLGLCLIISVAPTLDLYISNLFYLGDSKFVLQSFHYFSFLFRKFLIPVIIIYLLIIPIICNLLKIKIVFFGYYFSMKEIFLIWVSQAISTIIIVNLFFKEFWGRVRPNDIFEFGGGESFSAWYMIDNVCETNCSFVSGDASVGFSLIILYLITKNNTFLHLTFLCGVSLGFIRIIAGGHFLSDILFAGVIVVLSNVVIYQLYKRYYVN